MNYGFTHGFNTRYKLTIHKELLKMKLYYRNWGNTTTEELKKMSYKLVQNQAYASLNTIFQNPE